MRVALVYGGASIEHEVSLRSAQTVRAALTDCGHEVFDVFVSKDGTTDVNLLCDADIVFPLIHGKGGEDGSLQGLCRFLSKPFVGCDIAASALCLDKELSKRILSASGFPVAKSVTVAAHSIERMDYDVITTEMGFPLFVKAASLGSSVGVSKVREKAELRPAIEEALRYDTKALIEECIEGMELEVAMLGNETIEASLPGRIIPGANFYDFGAKYSETSQVQFELPAHIPEETSDLIRTLAIGAYAALGCEGMARVDFFLRTNGQPVINEINTIPGFTESSLYPKLWEVSGVRLPELITRLIELGFQRA
jgi:D-alanine-D-alanine ligase